MSRHLDAALRVLEGHDLQHSTEGAMPVTERCWRCEWSTATLDVGLCEPCANDLRAERDDPAPVVSPQWMAPPETPEWFERMMCGGLCVTCGEVRSLSGHSCPEPRPAYPDYWLTASAIAARHRSIAGHRADFLIIDDPPRVRLSAIECRALEQVLDERERAALWAELQRPAFGSRDGSVPSIGPQ